MPTLNLSTLPANAQQALLDFYEFLQKKHANKSINPEASASHQQPSYTDFKTFIMSIPQIEGIEFERKGLY
ncbi:DUF2281 domain-containing protein [Methylicorpusculum sp.]|uniref:DUF2281 domain-containing protein n=1 Tax=Methylicorpusculum sp. TaxID=2713644 RepID=UPI00271C41FE|nr:DUF2281 domain-containing protein [Methylicorpusculum sp.]MDO8844479.1 DUF2281 domain-containing protein [Methylicorpusculum sp.]MDP2179088.1 DUF2281 domain-containing protein [Methylicorpusculum sp.]MDP3529459.1 DUF2281 domain-containing protein [Methylicorpusculum sp.]MDZ4150836.1 DUF2281 domain-containing protein [Methylicorpusculum sp.]